MTTPSRLMRFSWSGSVPIFLVLALAVLPIWSYLTGDRYYVVLVARMIIYALAATALHLALGLAGLVSLGHGLFLGLGVYCVALPSYFGIDSGWVHLAWTVAVCGTVGLVTGAISLRTSGLGFLMITLAFAQMGYYLLVSLKQFGGDDGLGVPLPSAFGSYGLGTAIAIYPLALGLLLLLTWWAYRLRTAPMGMVLRAAQVNPNRVRAMGFHVSRYQLLIYVVSGVLCGVAGLLLANLTKYASPSSLSLQVSGDLLVMLVIGGIGYTFGPLLGSIAFLIIEEVLKGWTDHWMAIMGPAIVLIAMLGRGGICGWLERLDAGCTASAGPSTPGDLSAPPEGAFAPHNTKEHA